jgi:hypothetical protein
VFAMTFPRLHESTQAKVYRQLIFGVVVDCSKSYRGPFSKQLFQRNELYTSFRDTLSEVM